MSKRCGIPTEHESRPRAPKEHYAIGLQCRLDPVHLARHSARADTKLCGDMFGSHIAVCGKKQRQYRPHTCRQFHVTAPSRPLTDFIITNGIHHCNEKTLPFVMKGYGQIKRADAPWHISS